MKKIVKPQGPRTGGGGNSCSLSIRQNTEKLMSLVTEMPELLTEIQRRVLFYRISRAKFHRTESLILDGEVKDAVNYPHSNDILITDKFCNVDMEEVNAKAMATLLHEYLGLASINDQEYQISGAFLQNYESFTTRGYSFIANDSYEIDGGTSCVESVLQIQQIGNNMIVSHSANPPADFLALSKAEVKAFKELNEREWGYEKTVHIKNKRSGEEYIFTGGNCGRMLCDSLMIKRSDGTTVEYTQPIHGLDKIGCD
ncbi:hypothetical protein [Bdellovibrio sp. HCB2-146]|uniref:hypothetical protein n=1 Tax=Bdellovibrio sp. HCB2-146 TaxID=3394362 RepID=UPI0039BD1160